jgi:hypothetical protein
MMQLELDDKSTPRVALFGCRRPRRQRIAVGLDRLGEHVEERPRLDVVEVEGHRGSLRGPSRANDCHRLARALGGFVHPVLRNPQFPGRGSF